LVDNHRKSPRRLLHPDESEEMLENYRQRLAGEVVPAYIETRFIRYDGSEGWMEAKSSQIKWKGRSATVNFFSDITQRKQIEQDLRESQEEYRSLSKMLRLMCDTVPDMIWAKDINKRFTFANKALCRDLLNATDTSEPIGKTDLFFAQRERSRHPNNPNWHTFGELCQDSDTITLETKTDQQFDEFGNIKDKFIFLDVHKAPIFDKTGQIIGVVGSARDVTATKENEKKVQQWNEELEKTIEKRTASLKDVNAALRVLLKKREEDKKHINANIHANFKSIIYPLLNQLRNSYTQNASEDIIDILESSILEMAAPFSNKLSSPMVNLTPTEIQVATLVKEGKTNKESAQILNKSIRAISAHRENIRKKLGLKNKKVNLGTYLLNLD